MTTRLIVFATPAEAAATLARFHAQRNLQDCNLYQSDIGVIVIPGMGVLAVAQAICRYAHLANEVWNFGAAGALRDHLQLEQLVQIATIHRNPLAPDYIDERCRLFQKHVCPPARVIREWSSSCVRGLPHPGSYCKANSRSL